MTVDEEQVWQQAATRLQCSVKPAQLNLQLRKHLTSTAKPDHHTGKVGEVIFL